MKATLPFDSEFKLKSYMEKVIEYMSQPVTVEEQFEAQYNEIFARNIGTFIDELPPNASYSNSGISAVLIEISKTLNSINELSGKILYCELDRYGHCSETWPLYDSSSPGQLEPYKNLPNRNLTSNEADIFVEDLQEWFINSGFPNTVVEKVEYFENPGVFTKYIAKLTF
ncbi:hypothetical protein PP422_gp247 [Enterobacter phage vB_EhoM-IME523]|uniref:Uncharacterized protein n=1 Tax=Enterobacter phage vB_EhoM-IME523 TaxID=2596709 RepID=A0A7G3KB68_9CAUD|nr:hypothetical protein PP422_gp247 [Enterobacter phage vB_EhoM-IME523]QEA10667.1 hypothetical protein [Enterobacter phage vB_EhoM-IME523]